ncbi:hypothetical protein FE773_07790 [Caminibacter mediatlanticus TB-2]|uniref:Uncharacterized protein n=1 Tax=Caminibacter mediatlanticus TB-2 TaxID=391592 RepID=A0ABX5VA14_9BACT|nr:hypothetical protein [Caminibacter mediatlanticus]QCT95093.1 hypothetical protein FE773_07790 [Caminibacter mediatlanticus TB-2]
MKKTFNLLLIFILLILFNGCIFKRKKHHKQNNTPTQNNAPTQNNIQIKGIAYDGFIYNGRVQLLDKEGNILGESITSNNKESLGEFNFIIKKNKLPNIFYIKLLNGVDTGLDNLINKNDTNISFPIFSVGESNASFISVSPLSDIWYKIMRNYDYSFEETKKIINKAFNINNHLTLIYLNPKDNLLLRKIILFLNAIKKALPYDLNTDILVKYIISKQDKLIDINKIDYQNINVNDIIGRKYYSNNENKFINDNLFDILNASNDNNITKILTSLKSIDLINLKKLSINMEKNIQFVKTDINTILLSDILPELEFFKLNDFYFFKNKNVQVLQVLRDTNSEFFKDKFNVLDNIILNNLSFTKDSLINIINNFKKIYNEFNYSKNIFLGKELLYISLINNGVNASNALNISKTYKTDMLLKYIEEGVSSTSTLNSNNLSLTQYYNLILNMYSVYIMELKKNPSFTSDFISNRFENTIYYFFTIGFFQNILNNVKKSKYTYLILKNIMMSYARIMNSRSINSDDINYISKYINQIISKTNYYDQNNEKEKIITLISLCKYIDLYKFDNDLSSRIIPLTNKIFNIFNQKNIAYMASLKNFDRKFKSKLLNKEQISDNDIQSSIVYMYIDNAKLQLPVIPKIVDFTIK